MAIRRPSGVFSPSLASIARCPLFRLDSGNAPCVLHPHVRPHPTSNAESGAPKAMREGCRLGLRGGLQSPARRAAFPIGGQKPTPGVLSAERVGAPPLPGVATGEWVLRARGRGKLRLAGPVVLSQAFLHVLPAKLRQCCAQCWGLARQRTLGHAESPPMVLDPGPPLRPRQLTA